MDRSILVAENHQSSMSNLVSKSIESSIQIDSISIDLVNANEKSDPEKCEHFSIRGYVSDIRTKDWKRCWPFVSDGDSNKLEKQTCSLPPLHVPKFRFWRCQNCSWEIDAKGNTNSYGPAFRSCSNGFQSDNICSHSVIPADAAILPSKFEKAPKLGVDIDGIKVDLNASANLTNTTEYHPSSCNDWKGKKSEVANGPFIGHSMGSEDKLNQEILTFNCVATEVVSSPLQKPCSSDGKVAFKSKCNGSIEQWNHVSGHQEVADTDKIYEIGQEIAVNNKHGELMACGTSEKAQNVDEAVGIHKGPASGHPSLGLDECYYPSSESAEIMVGNNSQDLHHENSGGRKKTRKVRLLTELLCENGERDNNNIRTEDSMSNAIPDASAGVPNLPVPQGQVTNQGKVRRVLGQSRKRKLLQDEDWRPLQTNPPNKVCKEVRMLKRDGQFSNAVGGSESEEDVLASIGLQTGIKNKWTKCKVDRSPITVKKKNKKTLVFGESLALSPSKENLPNEIGERLGDGSKGHAADGGLVDNTFTGREMDLFPLPAPRMERKPSFGKKKSKLSQVDDYQVSPIPWNHGMLREGPMTRKDVDIHAGSVFGPFYSAEETSYEKGLNLSLNSYAASQSYDAKYIPQVEDRQKSLFTWQEGTSEDQVTTKGAEAKYIGNFGFVSKSTGDVTFGRKVDNDLSSKQPTYRVPFLIEKQGYTSQVRIGGCSVMQQKGFCSTSSSEKTIGSQEHPALARKDIDQRADKMSEQGGFDDIPMEIVELMAKNQYERCLPDAEHDKCQLETTNKSRCGQKIDFSKASGHREFSLVHQETTQMRNPWAKNGRNGIIQKEDNVGRSKQKSVDYFSQGEQNQFRMTQLEQIHNAGGFGATFKHQEKSTSGVQHCASSSSRQNGAQNCKWIGNMLGKRFSHPCLQPPGPCNTCQSIPLQSKEANQLCSSMMPNPIPFMYSISQKCAASSTTMDVLSHCPGSMRKENMNGNHDMRFLNAANLGKPNRNLGSETLSRRCEEYPFNCKHNGIELNQKPMGSLDLNPLDLNETIPAMHLLSLMDAGLKSSAPVNMNFTPKFLKGPPITHEHDPKEISVLDSGTYRATSTLKYLPYSYHGKNQVAENSHELIPAVPTIVGASASTFRQDKNFKMATGFTGQVSQEKEKRKGSDANSLNKGCRSQKSASTTGGANCGSIPVRSMQTMFFGTSDSVISPLPLHALENSTKWKLEYRSTTRAVQPHKSSFPTVICSVNKNPADFSLPEAGNMYMLAGEDLKVGKVVPSTNGSCLIKSDGRKRQRRPPTVKERDRHLIS